ncbi:MAG: thioesterase family protein [Rhodococcus sp.]|uniref:thioesterase family protein n=1 Tax=Rhodococcus TaxID=1827 RepID=UPI0016ADCC0F|nr:MULTISPECIES: thioesterase family protein [Rhodococcus]NLV80386.1 thioesterase family protein [Rhodococcus sp. (in: high G+C Gram-positive bacteria)]
MTVDHPFRDLTAITAVGAATWTAHIDPTWTIGPKVHGGCMLAVSAAAARRAAIAADADPTIQPLAVSSSFVAAPDPGDVEITTAVRKMGKQVSVVETELSQGGRVAVRSSVTLGVPDHDEPRYTVPHSATGMTPEPATDAIVVTPDHPMGQIVKLSGATDMSLDAATGHFLTGAQGEPRIGMWVRPRPADREDVDTSVLFALMAGDISAPVVMNRGVFGWAPTVQLTAYLRRIPEPGWLRVVAESTVLGQTWFEEDHTVVDVTGAVVVQSRQLAMLPR